MANNCRRKENNNFVIFSDSKKDIVPNNICADVSQRLYRGNYLNTQNEIGALKMNWGRYKQQSKGLIIH